MANDLSNMPRHIGIIMDGNGRWAQRRGLSRSEGHKAGAAAVREVTRRCRELGVSALTLYAFSKENWSRPKTEIAALFSLLLDFLGSETRELTEKEISLHVLGEFDGLPAPQRAALRRSMEKTASGDKMRLNLALNYGGRTEIVQAARKILEAKLDPAQLDEEKFASYLYTAGQPDPDLIIRTSGELRLSNFLLYQCAYSELYFTPTLWPDFTAAELDKAIAAYSARARRFGKTQEQIEAGA